MFTLLVRVRVMDPYLCLGFPNLICIGILSVHCSCTLSSHIPRAEEEVLYLLLVVSYCFSLYTNYYSWPSLISLYKDASQRPLVIHSTIVSRRHCYPLLLSRSQSETLLLLYPVKTILVVTLIINCNYYLVTDSTSSQLSSHPSSHKITNRTSYYGPMDNYIVRNLSKEDVKKFHMLLLRLTVSCGWALS